MDPDKVRALLEERSRKLPPDKLPTGCWEWDGGRTTRGYGSVRLRRGGPPTYTHRLSWAAHNGPIPEGLQVLHHCDNPPCWEPEHLFLGTYQDNTDDKIAKGRMRHGHLYGEDSPHAKLTWEQVRAIRAAYAAGERQVSLIRRFNVSGRTIKRVIDNQKWKEQANG